MILGYWNRADIQLDLHYVHAKLDILLSMHTENNNENRLTDEDAIKDLNFVEIFSQHLGVMATYAREQLGYWEFL